MLPQVEESASAAMGGGGEGGAFPEQGSRTDVRFLFDLVDEEAQGRPIAKMELLRGITGDQRVRDLIEQRSSLAGLIEPATWADDFMALKTEEDQHVSMAEMAAFSKSLS